MGRRGARSRGERAGRPVRWEYISVSWIENGTILICGMEGRGIQETRDTYRLIVVPVSLHCRGFVFNR